MSQSSDDAPTGPVKGTQVQTAPVSVGQANAPTGGERIRRTNRVRDLTGAALVVTAVFLPWNLSFGIGVPDSRRSLFAVLLTVTVFSLGAVVGTHVGPWRLSTAQFNPVRIDRLRVALNIPYLLLVLGFIVFDSFQTIRLGGTVHVPGGVGPGGWLGIAGCLLNAQPLSINAAADERRLNRWLKSAQILGYASIFAATLNTGFNLCWRIRYALQPSASASSLDKQNFAVIDTAVVYGVVALLTVLVASRWLLRGTKDSRLSTIALGASTLIAGLLVWILPVGREIDAFHGIAQNTSTAGVGYEGYLSWAAAAAIFAPRTLLSCQSMAPADHSSWRAAARNSLLLIVVWCLGSAVMRLTDLGDAVLLNYPFSRYDSMTLAGFDLATTILATWLRVNLANEALSTRLISTLSGFLFALTASRVIVGIVLAPRFQNSGASPNPVYGNNLAQQITSTFDVTLCGLALCVLIAAIATGQLRGRLRRRRRRLPAQRHAAATTSVPTKRPVPARIFRDSAKQSRPMLYRPPDNLR